MLLDIELAPDANFSWPDTSPQTRSPRSPAMGLAVYLFEGTLDVGENYGPRRLVAAPNLIVFARGAERVTVRAVDVRARLLLLSGEKIAAPAYSNGPLILSSPQALAEASRRYRAGEMGTLAAA